MDASAADFPQAALLFRDYYHEDWFVVYDDDLEIVEYFASEKGTAASRALAQELRALAELPAEQLRTILVELSPAYAPSEDHGQQLPGWLKAMSVHFDRAGQG